MPSSSFSRRVLRHKSERRALLGYSTRCPLSIRDVWRDPQQVARSVAPESTVKHVLNAMLSLPWPPSSPLPSPFPHLHSPSHPVIISCSYFQWWNRQLKTIRQFIHFFCWVFMKANFFGQLDCINLFKVLHFYSTLYRDLDIQSTHTHSSAVTRSAWI